MRGVACQNVAFHTLTYGSWTVTGSIGRENALSCSATTDQPENLKVDVANGRSALPSFLAFAENIFQHPFNPPVAV